jgi:hypothetical protein
MQAQDRTLRETHWRSDFTNQINTIGGNYMEGCPQGFKDTA